MGDIRQSSNQTYLDVIERLKKAGAEAIILGCIEIGLLVKPEDTAIPLFDMTIIHAEKSSPDSTCPLTNSRRPIRLNQAD